MTDIELVLGGYTLRLRGVRKGYETTIFCRGLGASLKMHGSYEEASVFISSKVSQILDDLNPEV